MDNNLGGINMEIIDDLIQGTDFIKAEDSPSMNSVLRGKVPHPLWVINCICGGGIPLSIQTEFSGSPSSGKTTSSYIMLGTFLRDNEDGVGIVIDTEGSLDLERLKALGVDTSRIIRLPATSIENGFANMFRMFNKLEIKQKEGNNVSIMIVFDSVSSGGTNKQNQSAKAGESVLNSGSMMELPRILKQNTANVFPYMENIPALIIYINQVFTTGIGSYHPTVKSGGGNGFHHNMQFELVYGDPKDVYEGSFIVGSECSVMMKKSKISPKFVNIPCYIDVRNGGKIDEALSFMNYLSSGDIGIIKTGSYYNIKDTIDLMIERYPVLKDNKDLMNYYKSIRKGDLIKYIKSDKDLKNFLQVRLIDFINDIYPLQKEINNNFRESLISDCSYFNKGESNNEKAE